jgi:DNA-binding CsgD family transcriptional regulator
MSDTQIKNLSRSEFIKVAGLTSVAGVIVACGLEPLITQPPPPPATSYPPLPNTSTDTRLQTEFDLTPLNATTFLLFIDNRNTLLGRREIARQLNISCNTLKDHITRIIWHVRSQGHPEVSTLNEAVNVASTVLGFN